MQQRFSQSVLYSQDHRNMKLWIPTFKSIGNTCKAYPQKLSKLVTVKKLVFRFDAKLCQQQKFRGYDTPGKSVLQYFGKERLMIRKKEKKILIF